MAASTKTDTIGSRPPAPPSGAPGSRCAGVEAVLGDGHEGISHPGGLGDAGSGAVGELVGSLGEGREKDVPVEAGEQEPALERRLVERRLDAEVSVGESLSVRAAARGAMRRDEPPEAAKIPPIGLADSLRCDGGEFGREDGPVEADLTVDEPADHLGMVGEGTGGRHQSPGSVARDVKSGTHPFVQVAGAVGSGQLHLVDPGEEGDLAGPDAGDNSLEVEEFPFELVGCRVRCCGQHGSHHLNWV